MQVMWHGEIDGVEWRTRQQLDIVGKDQSNAVTFGKSLRSLSVHVAAGGQLHRRDQFD